MNNPFENKPWYNRRWAYYIYLIVLSFPLSELAARMVGYEAYFVQEYTIASTPANNLIPDSILGLALAPGVFEITINDSLTYKTTHGTDGRRIVLSDHSIQRSDTALFFGCSFTYGMGVNDRETFASLLQQQQNQFEIVNYGVPGYGTVQSLIQLEDALKNGFRPAIAILFFSKLHFDRNTLAPAYRKALKHGYARSMESNMNSAEGSRFPYFDLNSKRIIFVPWKTMYKNWPGREKFAIINYLNSNIDKSNRTKLDPVKTTELLFKKIKTLCEQHKIEFKVCFMDENEDVKKIKAFCESNRIPHAAVGLQYDDPEYTNLPYDSHPNVKGHERIAQQIIPWLDLK